MLPNGTVNPGETNSFNHYALESVTDWAVAGKGSASSGLISSSGADTDTP